MPIRGLTQNRKNIARTLTPFSIRLSDRHLKMIAHPGPVAQDPDLLDIAGRLNQRALRFVRSGLEDLFPERLLTRNHEDHVVSHQAENSGSVAALTGVEPCIDEISNFLLISLSACSYHVVPPPLFTRGIRPRNASCRLRQFCHEYIST